MRRLGIAAAILGALLVVAATAALWLWTRAVTARQAAIAAAMPPGWVALVRQRTSVPPSARALALPRTGAHDGAAILWDTTRGVWRHLRMDSAWTRVREARPTAGDLLARTEIEHDPVLDRWVDAARASRWDNLPNIIRHSGPEGARNLFALQPPRYDHALKAAEILALRGWLRADAAQLGAAREDLGAVMGLGVHLVASEPTLDGFLLGRTVVHWAAQGFNHLAAVTRDTALARLAAEAAAWSAASTASSYAILTAAPDSALAMARDTSLSLGWRTASLMGWLAAPLQRPAGLLFGPPGRVAREIAPLAASGSSAARAVAALALATAETMDDAGPFGRWSRFSGARLLRALTPSLDLPRPPAADTTTP